MPFCRRCGGGLTADARFCTHCGESLEADSEKPERSEDYAVYDWTDETPAERPPLTQDERTTALFCHLATFAGFLFPFGNIIAPLVIWLLRRYDSPYIDHHGKEAVNFQITIWICFVSFVVVGGLILIASGIVVGIAAVVAAGILAVVAIAMVFFFPIMTLIAAVKASHGVEYRYPLAIRLVK
ncbi:MAG: zinc ribbon domain-containing protein [SAR202 cluster bacterium]|jgi:hypothetical protein|nr:hypothetical protein [Chloroflexota bacterium]MDP6421516.1 zinc ribbon domain-containing protein [SAR202 cluster bacterium]HAL49492.1 hypothetical protein [Dehalococcoidia bacterium]MDP6664787.1 zinc ribbon domain-containing protein [SAR202 cluster bacterium]MDP6801210.1 zinc ribbon domain-containing protein [SAR202 cluster bacterium]|tara:strand:+ start:1010 stop:1558 length:549 start_codon:yes stop_codon:yes gene_type:complete